MANPKVGDFVELAQVANGKLVWLPFLVTSVDGETVSGVAFNGQPGNMDFPMNGTEAFAGVSPGDSNRQWRPKAEDEQDAEGNDEQPPSPFEAPSDE